MDVREIGKAVRAAREARGATRHRMGKMTKLHPETIVNIEEGFTGYNIFALMTYCGTLGFDIMITPKNAQQDER